MLNRRGLLGGALAVLAGTVSSPPLPRHSLTLPAWPTGPWRPRSPAATAAATA
ncbi:hypothetical protein ACFQU7_06120 [Pseudoroseomonas wenyumeiae]